MFIVSKIVGRLNRNAEERYWHSDDVDKTKHLDLPELTSEEFALLQETWPCFKFEKKNVLLARLYKMKNGFDPYYISVGYHSIIINKQLNPRNQICSFENKALIDIYLQESSFPLTYIRCINNNLYDKEMNEISFEDSVRLLKERKQFVIKPALNTSQGRGVKKIDLQQVDNASIEWFKDLYTNATANFIVQEIATQHTDIARLNPTSLNCCRVTSIYVGGKYTSATMLKIGKQGSTMDNWRNSYVVGINKEGLLNDIGWDNSFNQVTKTDNGIQFGGIKYPCFDDMVSSLEYYHKKYFPQCAVIGWDVFVDANNKPCVIEANLTIPGITAAQLCSGPFFKDVHDEIVKRIH